MKKFIKKGLLFFVFLFIVDKSAILVLNTTQINQYDRRLEYVIEGVINKDLIVLGSSIGASNILAGQIETETGYKSYNLSYPGSNIIFHEFVLKALLKFNKKPKIIILTIDSPFEFIEEETLKFRFDRLYPLSNYNYINTNLVKYHKNIFFSHFFYLARLKKNHIKMNKIEKPIYNPIDSSGSMPFIKNRKIIKIDFLEKIDAYTTINEEPIKLEAIKNIQQICSENKIKLFFVFSPYYKSFNSSFKNRFDALFLPSRNTMVYDTLNPIYQSKDYFFDVSHLSKNGAIIFTSEISKFILSN